MQANAESIQMQMQQMIAINDSENAAIMLQNLIQNASNANIPQLKITTQSKSWWSDDLTEKQKEMAELKRLHQKAKKLLYNSDLNSNYSKHANLNLNSNYSDYSEYANLNWNLNSNYSNHSDQSNAIQFRLSQLQTKKARLWKEFKLKRLNYFHAI